MLVEHHDNDRARLVRIRPQYRDCLGAWGLLAPGLLVGPQVARVLAPARLAMAATIDGSPVDPMPIEQHHLESEQP